MKNPGSIIEPACLYADTDTLLLRELQHVIKTYQCRSGVILCDDVCLVPRRSQTKYVAVIAFPYGSARVDSINADIAYALAYGVTQFDVCVNLSDVLECKFKRITNDFSGLVGFGPIKEIKVIIQLPFLWQYAKDCIDPLICALAHAGVPIIKDWTSVSNFSKPVDISLDARLEALDYVRSVIAIKKLPLKVKIAGGVRADNAPIFVQHGADILGVGYSYVHDVVKALESKEEK